MLVIVVVGLRLKLFLSLFPFRTCRPPCQKKTGSRLKKSRQKLTSSLPVNIAFSSRSFSPFLQCVYISQTILRGDRKVHCSHRSESQCRCILHQPSLLPLEAWILRLRHCVCYQTCLLLLLGFSNDLSFRCIQRCGRCTQNRSFTGQG